MLEPPGGRPWLLYLLLGASLALNLVMALRWPDPPTADDAAALADETAVAPSSPPSAPEPSQEGDGDVSLPSQGDEDSEESSPSDYAVVEQPIERNLAWTFRQALGTEGDAVAAVFARIFVWDLDLRRDIQRGDHLRLAYRGAGSDVEIPVAWLHSNKLGRTLRAYSYRAADDRWPSYWYPDGTEVPYRLVDGPIRDYIQITARLDDRAGHDGYDFKTEVGTPVYAPRSGRVTRIDWNTHANGKCVEIRYNDGVDGLFLHLDRTLVKPGQSVTAGTLIAHAGNTGRSTAPHLHYQVERGGKVIDPADYHGTVRRKLPPEELPALEARILELDTLLGVAETGS